MAKDATPKIGLRATAGKRNLRFGLVNVGISMSPATDDSARVRGKYVDPDSLTPVTQQYVNAAGEVVKPIRAYPYGDAFVTLDEGDVVTAEADDQITLVANIPLADVPAEWIDKTYLAWPTDATHNDAYALVSHYLRSNARAFIGTTVANGTTKALAVRWSDTYGTLVCQLLSYHAQVRWANVNIAREGVAAIPDPDPAMADMAASIFDAIGDDFAWDEVEDEYGLALEAAITAKATGQQSIAAPSAPAPAPAADLMAALQASLPAAKKAAKKAAVA